MRGIASGPTVWEANGWRNIRNSAALRNNGPRAACKDRNHRDCHSAAVAAQGDPIHYETFESPVPEEYGQVKFCVSRLYPGLVGDECFMTKGHCHTLLETGEIYLCLEE